MRYLQAEAPATNTHRSVMARWRIGQRVRVKRECQNRTYMCPVTVNGAAESSPSRARTHTSHPRILSFPHPTSLLPSSPPLMWRDSSRSSSVVRQHSLFTLQNLTIKQLPSKSHSKPLKVSLQLLKKPSPLIKVQVTHN